MSYNLGHAMFGHFQAKQANRKDKEWQLIEVILKNHSKKLDRHGFKTQKDFQSKPPCKNSKV